MWPVLALGCYAWLAMICGRMIVADEAHRPRHQRMAPLLVVLLSATWLPVLVYCSVALGIDTARASHRR